MFFADPFHIIDSDENVLDKLLQDVTNYASGLLTIPTARHRRGCSRQP
jgi:hypothetical protein